MRIDRVEMARKNSADNSITLAIVVTDEPPTRGTRWYPERAVIEMDMKVPAEFYNKVQEAWFPARHINDYLTKYLKNSTKSLTSLEQLRNFAARYYVEVRLIVTDTPLRERFLPANIGLTLREHKPSALLFKGEVYV